jgi:hypothetical protein
MDVCLNAVRKVRCETRAATSTSVP